ncbi:hypothetical protein ASPCAL06479 [Aspergillus calidoustus]|uniref:F-box domain-containing protein n=1 Tax=Aspergillus calidoustus TaxID=454130 RepID=A0A0U5G0D6_ASPCI|nr:hypothetical protein ASPCAL06479 [Aspergillus calidoustus]
MIVHFPVEILSIIFKQVAHGLTSKKQFQDAHRLRLVSTTVQAIVEPILYRSVDTEDDGRVEQVFWSMMRQPRLARLVKRVDLTDECTERNHIDSEDEEEEDEGCGKGEEGKERQGRPESNSDESQRLSQSDDDSKSRHLSAAVEIFKSKFQAHGERIRSLESHWVRKLLKSRLDAIQWALLVQLSNLTSLRLKINRGKLAQMAILLHLPRLENFDFTVAVGGEGVWSGEVSSEGILESIISSTNRLKSLRFENIDGSCYSPKQHDAEELKEILDRHAETLENLDIVCGMDDEGDWRMPQECVDINGCFGSMKHFTQLANLSIQLELLLGRPAGNQHRLKDVLPPNLCQLTLLTLADYYGDEHDMVWKNEHYVPHLEELARAAEDDQSFTSLDEVRMHLTRKDRFNPYRAGKYEEGVLGQSRINFRWS